MNVLNIDLGDMNPLTWIKSAFTSVDKLTDLGSEFIVDKDAKIAFDHEVTKMRLQLKQGEMDLRIAELSTKTIPWVDALHKLGRMGLSLISMIFSFTVIVIAITVNDQDLTMELLAFGVAGGAPGAIYNWIKGKGQPVKGE